MSAGFASSGSGGQGFAIRLEADGDTKLGNSSGDLHQVTGTLHLNDNVFFLENGRVGINTDSPAYKLGVAGNVGINEYIYHNGDANTFLKFTDDVVILKAMGRSIVRGDPAAGLIYINNGGHDLDVNIKNSASGTLFYTDAGNARVGIGTSTPTYELDVEGDIGVNQYIYHNGDADTFIKFTDDDINLQAGGVNFIDITEGANSEITFNEAGADIDFRVEGDSDTHLLFVEAGTDRVGIGTSSPATTLHVADTDGRVRAEATAGNHPGFEWAVAGTRKWIVYNDPDNSDNLEFKTNSNVRMVIEQDGNVGIGTTSPAATLSVVGIISSSHGATLGNLMLNEDGTSLQLSGTLSSSAGATFLGNVIAEDVKVSGSITVGGTAISSTPAELNLLDASTTSEASDGAWAVVQRVAKATIDSNDWGVGLNSLGVTIPDNSIVTKVVIDTTTTFVGGIPMSEITLGLYDGSTSLAALVGATVVLDAGADSAPYVAGLTDMTSTLAAFKLTAAGEVKLNVGEGALTAGVADVYIYYIIGA